MMEPSERNSTTELELGLNFGVANAKFKKSFEKRATRRVDQVSDRAIELSNVSPEEFEASIEQDSEFGEVYRRAIETGARSSDHNTREGLSAIIASAVSDPAKVDSISFIMTRIEKLEPLHLRALMRFPREIDVGLDGWVPRALPDNQGFMSSGTDYDERRIKDRLAEEYEGVPFPCASLDRIAEEIKAELEVAELVMSEMVGLGFALARTLPKFNFPGAEDIMSRKPKCYGLSAISTLFRSLIDSVLGLP